MTACQELALGSYCMLRDPAPNEPGDVLLVFSAADTPANKFLWSKRLARDRRKQIYLNCPDNQWYLQGIPGLGDTPQTAASELQRLISRYFPSARTVCAAGGSMGGYAALLYGSLMGLNSILAFGAELTLGLSGANSAKHVGTDDGLLIRELNASRSAIRLVYGENFFPDLMGVLNAFEQLDTVRLEVMTIVDRPHSIPPYLEQKYGLDNILNSLFSSQSLPVEASEIGSILTYPELVRVGYVCQEHMRTGKLDGSAREYLDLLAHLNLHDMPDRYGGYCFAFKAILQKIVDDDNGAMESAGLAARMNPANLLVMAIAGRVAFECKQYEIASSYAERAIKLQEPELFNLDLDSYVVLARCAAASGRHDEARRILSECLELRPNFKKAALLLAKI